MLNKLVVLSCLGFVLMFGTIIYAVLYGSLLDEGPILIDMPWGLVSLVDIYLGLLIFSFWVIWREGFTKTGFLWVFLILVLGNMLSCLYILKVCKDAKGDLLKFWLGQQLQKVLKNA